jgi:hypothetical protein
VSLEKTVRQRVLRQGAGAGEKAYAFAGINLSKLKQKAAPRESKRLGIPFLPKLNSQSNNSCHEHANARLSLLTVVTRMLISPASIF